VPTELTDSFEYKILKEYFVRMGNRTPQEATSCTQYCTGKRLEEAEKLIQTYRIWFGEKYPDDVSGELFERYIDKNQ